MGKSFCFSADFLGLFNRINFNQDLIGVIIDG